MDGKHFDVLTKSLVGSSRRTLLKRLPALLGGGVAALVGLETEAASCRQPGDICRENANCCSGTCGAADRTGRRYCQCRTTNDCPVSSNKCLSSTCTSGTCVSTRVTCPTPDVCHLPGSCNPSTGVCSNPTAPNNTSCVTSDPCVGDGTCQDGQCIGPPLSESDEACDTTAQCCDGLTCTPAGLCCASGKSCSNAITGGTDTCCPNATDICTTSDECCSLEQACTTGLTPGIFGPCCPAGTTPCIGENRCTCCDSTETCNAGSCSANG